MEPVSVTIQEFESKIVSVINETKLHPAIVELVIRNIYNQVKDAVVKQAESEMLQNNSKPEITSEPKVTE